MEIVDIMEIKYINLDRRPDRREQMEAQLRDLGLSAQRVEAIDGDDLTAPPQDRYVHACLLSHIKAIKGVDRDTLILEDDAIIGDLESLPNLPDKWDIAYLGGAHVNREPTDTGWVAIPDGVSGCYGYMVNIKFRDELLRILEGSKLPIDLTLAREAANHDFFAINPFIVGHRPGWSDISNQYRE